MASLLKLSEIPITDKIIVKNPTVSEVLEDELKYYSTCTLLTSTPYEMMVQLDDIGIDYETITDFDLFVRGFCNSTKNDLNLILPNINPQNFQLIQNEQTQEFAIYDNVNDIFIDKKISEEIQNYIRKINNFKKNISHAGNKAAKKYLLEKNRRKLKKLQRQKVNPILENAVISMVNNRDFPYGYDSALDLTLFRFNSSIMQVQKLKNFESTISGIYAGTVDSKKIDMKQLSWL